MKWAKYYSKYFQFPFFAASSIADTMTNRMCKLNCFLADTRSIVSKIIELEEYVFEYNPDVIMT